MKPDIPERSGIMPTRMSPQRYHALVALVLTLGGTAALFFVLQLHLQPWSWYRPALLYLLSVNVVTAGYYGFDKAQARQQSRRVPEAVLHGLAVAGGTLGAWLGMRLFRHKTIKAEFRLVFWFIAVLQAGLIAALVYRLWKSD
jgi:uncharacterized membrane protein YsdA (DUF1294 family)